MMSSVDNQLQKRNDINILVINHCLNFLCIDEMMPPNLASIFLELLLFLLMSLQIRIAAISHYSPSKKEFSF